jgi:integrase
MARKIRDAELDSRKARERLKARGKPYWRSVERGLHIGYRRLKGRAGSWTARHYDGDRGYSTEVLGIADDFSDAFAGGKVDPKTCALLAATPADAVLSFDQAVSKARARKEERTHVAAGGSGPFTVQNAVENYLAWYQANRKAFADARRWTSAFILPALGHIEASALTTTEIRKWHENLAAQPARIRTAKGEPQRHRALAAGDADAIRRRRATANRVLTLLRAALNRAWRDGLVPSDAGWRRAQPFGKVDAARVQHLSVAEAKRLVNACSPLEFRTLVQAALATGARYGELCRLRVADFNGDAGTLAVHVSKTGKPRHIVLAAEGISLFRELTTGRSGGEVMLLRANGTPWSKGAQGVPMLDACKNAKIEPRVSFHILRHTWASLAVMAGMPLMVVARNLGHVDTKMVERVYGHLTQTFIVRAVREHAPSFGFKPLRKNVREIGAR